MVKPGVYQTAFSGLTFSELWRMGGPLGFISGVYFKLTGYKTGEVHLPSSHFQKPIADKEVEPHLMEKVADLVTQAKRIGYDQYSFFTSPKDESNVDGIAFIAINGECTLFIGYVKTRYFVNGKEYFKDGTVSTGSVEWQDNTSTAFVTHNFYLNDPVTNHIRVKANTIYDLHRVMRDHIRSQKKAPKHFSTFAEFTTHMNQATNASEKRKVDRGLYVFKREAN